MFWSLRSLYNFKKPTFRLFLSKKSAAWETLASWLWFPCRAEGLNISHISSANICRAKGALQLVPPDVAVVHAPGRAEQHQELWLMLVASAPWDWPSSHSFLGALCIQQGNVAVTPPLPLVILLQEKLCFLPWLGIACGPTTFPVFSDLAGSTYWWCFT